MSYTHQTSKDEPWPVTVCGIADRDTLPGQRINCPICLALLEGKPPPNQPVEERKPPRRGYEFL